MLNSFEMNHFAGLRAKVQAPCNHSIDYAIIILTQCVTSPAVTSLRNSMRLQIECFQIVTFQAQRRRKTEEWTNEHPWCSVAKMRSFVVSRFIAYCNEMLLCLFGGALYNCYSFWPLAVRTQTVTILEQEQERDPSNSVVSFTQETITNHFGYETVINMSKMCQSYFSFRFDSHSEC